MNENSLTYPNPWDFKCIENSFVSSNGKFKIEYFNLNEIAMGAPLGGECYLNIENERKIKLGDWCGGPACWNSEETKFAIPVWEKKSFKGTVQKLMIVDLETGLLSKSKKDFSVLDIRSFDNDIVYGYDSPIHKTRTVAFDLKKEKLKYISQSKELKLLERKKTGIEVLLCEHPDAQIFNQIANILETELHLKFTEKLDGLEQKYWDFYYRDIEFVLHLDNYIGILIFPKLEKGADVLKLTKELEENIHKYSL